MPPRSKTNELRLQRAYDAPLALVWEAWTDPEQAAKWWGPRGFTLTTHSKDLRPGGHWAYTMHGPDGTDYENKAIYHEVVERQRLVYDHGGNDDRPPLFRVTVTFEEIDGRTHLDMRFRLESPEAAEQIRQFIKQANGDSTWDRFAEYLEKERNHNEVFVINRSFEASQAVLFDMWTDPAHFSRWLPPTGFTMQFHRVEIRPGGGGFYEMTNGAGVTFHGRVNYLEICRPERLVYTQQFCDAEGNISRHPGAPTWPETMLTVVEFTSEGPEQTRATVTWKPYGAVTPAELAAFIDARTGMTLGWTGSFDKLDDLLELGAKVGG
jgi:uncharacterized protein YndB with AHSA1/START domain